jgi:hypothetical protein
MSGDWRGTLWTLLVTFCIVITRCTETFWSPCTCYILYLSHFGPYYHRIIQPRGISLWYQGLASWKVCVVTTHVILWSNGCSTCSYSAVPGFKLWHTVQVSWMRLPAVFLSSLTLLSLILYQHLSRPQPLLPRPLCLIVARLSSVICCCYRLSCWQCY